MKRSAALLLAALPVLATAAQITIDPDRHLGPVPRHLHGQFIEHLGTCINGGIFEPGSPLADESGFRSDVAAMVRELDPRLLRWPGGTFTKVYHWQDGIGPREDRRKRPNLIWGGIENNLFGTDEFIRYCRLVGAEPYVSVNMATGTAEEAANWVEYCNGTGDTHYANLRRQNGSPEPHNVKLWGLGNEEEAAPDAGVLQDPRDYAKTAWHFAKLMKLQDPSIRLVVAGVSGNMDWNRTVLDSLHPVADYLSAHWYFNTTDYHGTLARVAAFDRQLAGYADFLSSYPAKPEFSHWHRFPPRGGPIRLAIDEWGLWNSSGTPADTWGLYQTYTWRDALAVASWLNAMHRHAATIGFANWAQLVNVIAPIRTNPTAAVRQTVFHPLALYSKHAGHVSIAVKCDSPPVDGTELPSLDACASIDEAGGRISLFVVNRHPNQPVEAAISIGRRPILLAGGTELSAASIDAATTLDAPETDAVRSRQLAPADTLSKHIFPPATVTLLDLAAQR